MKHSYIVVRPRNPELPMTGRNTEVLLDGKPIDYVSKINFEVEAGGISVMHMTLVGATTEIRGLFFEGRDPKDVPMNRLVRCIHGVHGSDCFKCHGSDTDPATGKEPF